jgi:hypothetical protein
VIALALTPLWQARAPRFLLILLAIWTTIRLLAHVPSALPVPPLPGSAPYGANWSAAQAVMPGPQQRARAQAVPAPAAAYGPAMVQTAATTFAVRPAQRMDRSGGLASPLTLERSAGGYALLGQHRWRMALFGQKVPDLGGNQSAAALPVNPHNHVVGATPLLPLPRWPDQPADRWSLSFAAYWRDAKAAPATLGPGGLTTLGGSQTAVRVGYQIDRTVLLRAYARLTDTPGPRGQSDIAVGLAVRPVLRIPVDVHLEQRFAVDGGARDATLVYAAGGVDDQPLPHDFRLSAYAQAGIAYNARAAGFADAILVVEREIASKRGGRLSLGQVTAASVQPGARRVDVGPRVTIDLPRLGNGASIALDWRERVAGTAQPGSGLALTVAADF